MQTQPLRNFAFYPTFASFLSPLSPGSPSPLFKPRQTTPPIPFQHHGLAMPTSHPSPPRSSLSSADRTSPMSGSTIYTSMIFQPPPGSCGGHTPDTVAHTEALPSVQPAGSAHLWMNSRPATTPAVPLHKATNSLAQWAHGSRQDQTWSELEILLLLIPPPMVQLQQKNSYICRTRANLPTNFQTISIYTPTTMCVVFQILSSRLLTHIDFFHSSQMSSVNLKSLALSRMTLRSQIALVP